MLSVTLGILTKVFELFLEFFQIFVRQIFKIDQLRVTHHTKKVSLYFVLF